jgi:hypothetical protein
MRAEKASLEAFEAWDKDKHEEETKNGKRTDERAVRTRQSLDLSLGHSRL